MSIKYQSNKNSFKDTVSKAIENFSSAFLIKKLTEGNVRIEDYHTILTTIFHQTRSGPYTFAAAAFNCDWKFTEIKEYLLKHAEEERTHWRWVIDDLNSTNYAGVNPLTAYPHQTCEAYISFNERMARVFPPARLGIALVLEGIGSHFGENYGLSMLSQLKISKDQASFFLSHGQTDKIHAEDLMQVIDKCEFDETEWGWMTHAAYNGGILYREMYNHDGYKNI